MAIILDPETGKITFGVVADGTHDAIAIDLASQFGVSEDFNDDYSLDNWTDVGTGFGVNNNVMDVTGVKGGTNNGSGFDLGAGNVSDTNFVLRFKFTFTSLPTIVTDDSALYLSIDSADQSLGANTTGHDALTLQIAKSSSSQLTRLVPFHSDGGTVVETGATALLADGTGPTYYIEIKRTSTTSATWTLFSDSAYTGVIATTTATIPVGITGLRHIVWRSRSDGSVGAEVITAEIDDVQFWNSKSTPIIESATNWRIRFKLDITNLDDGANAISKRFYIGLFDKDAISGAGDSHDGYALKFFLFNTGSGQSVITPDNQTITTISSDAVFATLPAVSTRFYELRRDSLSQTTTSIFSDASYTTLIEQEVVAGISGSDNLKYFKVMNDVGNDDSGEATQGAIDGTIDDIEFTDIGALLVEKEKTFEVNALIQQVNGKCGVDLTDLNVYYTFDEGSGNLINNATAIGSVDAIADTDGTVPTGITRSVTGQVSDAYEFNGETPSQASNRISLDASNVSDFDFMINDGEVYTVNLWVNPQLIPSVQGFADLIINQNNSGGSRGFLFHILSDGLGKNAWRIRPREAGEIFDVFTTANASNGGSFSSFEWHMLTAVADIDARTVDYYLDGQFKVQSGAGTASPPFAGSGDSVMKLGAVINTQLGRAFDGQMDEVSIWRRSLSSNEIGQLYALNAGGTQLQDYNGGAHCFSVNALIKAFGDNGCSTLFQEDFSSSVGWVQTGTQVTISGGTLNGWGPDGTPESQIYDLQSNNGITLSDIRWVTEFKFRYTAFESSTGHNILSLADSSGDVSLGGIPSASFNINKQIGPDPIVNGVLRVDDGATLFSSTGIGLEAFINTDLFIRLERISITQFKLSIATDLAQQNQIAGSPVTLTEASFSNVVGLDHIQSRTGTNGSEFRDITGTVDDLTIDAGCPTFTINAILIPPSCSPWKHFDDFVSSTARLSFSTANDQTIEIPPVGVPTYVKSIKTRIKSSSTQGSVKMFISLFPMSTGGNPGIASAGIGIQDTDSVSMASLSNTLVTHTFTFAKPVILMPNVRYGLAWRDLINNVPGLDYGIILKSEKDFTNFSPSITSVWREPDSGTPQNFMLRGAQGSTWAIDINILNSEAGVICFFVDAHLIGREGTVVGQTLDWQFREVRQDNNLNKRPTYTFGDEPPAVDINAGINVGTGYIFKTFKKSDITGDSISVTADVTGTVDIRVYDGLYDRRDNEDFPQGLNEPAKTGDGKGIGLLGNIALPTGLNTTVLPSGSINYAGSTEDLITVFVRVRSASGRARVSDITLLPDVSFDLENSVFTTEQTGVSDVMDFGYFYVNDTSAPFMEHTFAVDACLGVFVLRRSIIGDLIIKVLQANPSGLTGLQITDEVRLLRPTTKTSRIKNWIGFLDTRGIIVDDGSNPDWYKTIWTLVP